jgi:hypothetical protein
LAAMPEPHIGRRTRRSVVILRDVQFWIPIVVLIGGLLVLGWIR